jgi:AraC-like DNA-binding protein
MKSIAVRKIKNLFPEPLLNGSFSLRSLSEFLSGNDLEQVLHRHDFYFILVLDKARGSHEIDFIPYRVKDFTIFIMRPGQVHELYLEGGSTGYLIQFTKNFYSPNTSVNQFFRKAINQNYYQVPKNIARRVDTLMAGMLEEYSFKRDGYLETIKASLDIFFIQMARLVEASETIKSKNFYSQQKLDELLSLVETNLAEKKKVSDYAKMMHLSGFQLNSLTKQFLGKNCSAVINDQMILESKRLLLATTSTINEIAFNLGYEDVSYFIRIFKKLTGLTPQAFRENFT